MKKHAVQVYFDPLGVAVRGTVGDSLISVARDAGIHINASCGGDGACGSCKVKVLAGKVEGGDQGGLSSGELDQGYRLACTARVRSDVRVEIPRTSLLDHTSVDEYGANLGDSDPGETQVAQGLILGAVADPAVFKVCARLSPPTRGDALADLDRLLRALKKRHGISPVSVSSWAVKRLGPTLRSANWEVTVTLVNLRDRFRLIQVEAGDTSDQNYAVVVDIGTTTLAAQLLDLKGRGAGTLGGRVLAAASMYNPQVSYGEDVISRILQASKPHGMEALQQTVVDGINRLFTQLFAESGASRERVSHLVVAGNPTMMHLFLGLDPKSIREAPYVTTVSSTPVFRACNLGLELGDHVSVWSFPLVASWVGGDVVAGVLASGLWQRADTTLFIDVGTNGELVLGNRHWMVTTACSAGPAFEGGGIRCGMRAAPGAIEMIQIQPETLEPQLKVIGGERPSGICGSGLIAAVAELFDKGAIAPNGRYHDRTNIPRVRPSEYGGCEYVLAWAEETDIDRDIVLTESDIQNLIRTKAAIFAGCRVLLGSVGATFKDVDRVILAGGFGRSLNLAHATCIGLLPPLVEKQFLYIGNGALLGGRLVSSSHDLFDTAKEVARKLTPVELTDNPVFMEEYVAASFLPHTDR